MNDVSPVPSTVEKLCQNVPEMVLSVIWSQSLHSSQLFQGKSGGLISFCNIILKMAVRLILWSRSIVFGSSDPEMEP